MYKDSSLQSTFRIFVFPFATVNVTSRLFMLHKLTLMLAKFKGTARTATASFSSGEKGFVVSGKSGTTQFDDIWEFHPNEYDDDEY